MTDKVAPKGKFRIVGFDSFDHETFHVGDFKTLELARETAQSRAGSMTLMYIHDDTGAILEKYGSF